MCDLVNRFAQDHNKLYINLRTTPAANTMSESLDDAVYSNVILHLLHMNDRFAKNFDRWSVDRKSDRLVLSILLTVHAQIECQLVHTLHMLYPGRVQGPFVLDKTMTIEILNHSVKADFFAPARPPDYVTERPQKRSKGDPDSDVDLASITDHLRESLAKTNNSLCTLGKMATGRDEAGVWVSYDIVCNTRLNLAFFTAFILGQGCVQVRNMRLRVHPFKQVFLRLYERSERRVVGVWEVVPVYEKQGVFVCMRKKLKAVQGVA